METITQIGTNIFELLTNQAERVGKETGLIERQRKFTASSLLQTLVVGFQSNPEASYTDLAISAASVGVDVSPQAIEQRFTEKTTEFLKKMVMESMKLTIEQRHPRFVNLMERFKGVYLQDSTIVKLPSEIGSIWEGCGGSNGQSAAIKLQTQWEYKSGKLVGITMQNGRVQDQASPYQTSELPCGALRIEDLGYFSLARMKKDHQKGIFWISRLKAGTKVCSVDGEELDLVNKLQACSQEHVMLKVYLGVKEKVLCRLLIKRAPEKVVSERLRKLHRKAKKQGRSVSKRQKVLVQWTLLITNVPEAMLSFEEVFLVYRVRWQIELLFKAWKSYFKLNSWRSQNKWRILCELYAKLIGVIISQWLFTLMYNIPERSFFKATSVIRHYAIFIAFSISDLELLSKAISRMNACFSKACRTNSRSKKPATYQTLVIS